MASVAPDTVGDVNELSFGAAQTLFTGRQLLHSGLASEKLYVESGGQGR